MGENKNWLKVTVEPANDGFSFFCVAVCYYADEREEKEERELASYVFTTEVQAGEFVALWLRAQREDQR